MASNKPDSAADTLILWVFMAALVIGGLWLFSSLVDASGIADHHEPDPSCQYVDCGGDGSTEADY